MCRPNRYYSERSRTCLTSKRGGESLDAVLRHLQGAMAKAFKPSPSPSGTGRTRGLAKRRTRSGMRGRGRHRHWVDAFLLSFSLSLFLFLLLSLFFLFSFFFFGSVQPPCPLIMFCKGEGGQLNFYAFFLKEIIH